MHKFFIPSFLFLAVWFFSNCASDSEEMLLTTTVSCDTLSVSYENQIFPIIQNNCLACHTSGTEQGGIVLDSYELVKTFAQSGLLMGVIDHREDYSPMPQDADKLPDCEIAKIRAWINQGALNN